MTARPPLARDLLETLDDDDLFIPLPPTTALRLQKGLLFLPIRDYRLTGSWKMSPASVLLYYGTQM